MNAIRTLLLAGGLAALLPASAQELTRYQYDRAGNIVGIVVGPEAATAETVEVDPVAAKVGERVRIHTEAGAQVTSVLFGAASATPVLNDHAGLEVVVPSGATSGPVKLFEGSTPIRESQAFAVVPAEIPSATVAGIRPATVGEEMDLGVIGGRWTLLSFDSASAGATSLQLNALDQPAAAPVDVRVLNPLGVVVHTGTTTMTTQSTHVPMPQAAGTHILALRTPRWARVRAQLKADSLLVPDGTPTTVTVSQPAPTARLQFSATAGEDFGLGFDAMTANVQILVEVRKPDGAIWRSTRCSDGYAPQQCSAVLRDVPATGLYTVTLRPATASVSQFSARVWLSRELLVPLAFGTPTVLAMPRPGQIATLAFDGTAGQSPVLSLKGIQLTSSAAFEMVPRSPTGICLLSPCTPWDQYSEGFQTFPNLAASGTHTLQVRLRNGGKNSGTGSVTLTLTDDIRGTLTADGDYTQIDAPHYGQRHRLTFDGVAGDDVSIGISNFVTTPANEGITTEVYRPNGSLYRTSSCGGYSNSNDCGEGLRNLPETGKYMLLVRPTDRLTLAYSARVWLSSELKLPLAINTPLALSMPRPGQLATLSFSGSTGQKPVFSLKDTTFGSSNTSFEFNPTTPSGICMVNANCSPWRQNATEYVALPHLAETGTYTIPVRFWNNGRHSGAGSTTLTLSEDIPGTLATDGDYSQVSSTLFGQRQRLTFDAIAGDSLAIGFSSFSTTPTGNGITFDVFRPSGALYRTSSCGGYSNSNDCGEALRNLPESGTWTFVIRPTDRQTLGYTARVWLSRELIVPLAIDAPTALSLPRPGQLATLTFQGTIGQRLVLSAKDVVVVGNNNSFELIPTSPAGVCLLAANCAPWRISTPGFTALPTLAETGTYRVPIRFWNNGSYSGTGSASMTLSKEVELVGQADGAYTQASTDLYGQQHRIVFTGTAGENWGLGVNPVTTTPAGLEIDIDVYRPNGTKLKAASCGSTGVSGKCGATMRNLPETGDYLVLVKPRSQGVLGYSARIYVSREFTQTLSVGTPSTLSLPRPGQIATLLFDGTAGQRLRLSGSAFASSPINRNFEFLPLRPTGACLLSTNCAPWWAYNTSYKDFPALLETGQHKIQVEFLDDGRQTPTGSVTLNLAPTP